ncbi:MAG: phosphoribosylamine---glycine ligase [Chthoniobacter sp.]|jgi:phosphoribosylamine--glycine ligase|nr:phosphoribosylamine---glycine ligase [Chthoniobacter sp.]
MKVLVLGGGGREHALVWKLRQSPRVTELFCAPGNAGTAHLARNVPLAPTDEAALLKFARDEKIDLTVVGPDDALAAGIVDAFEKEGLRIFGPNRSAARLESSKIFAKEFMQRHGIPTAKSGQFSSSEEAHLFCQKMTYPAVLKADGLALGKGVIIAENAEQAAKTIYHVMERGAFGEAGRRLVVEEFLEGEECSIHALVDGSHYALFPGAQDHKRALDGDCGPNTGGMGTYSPAPALSAELVERVHKEVMQPFLRGIAAEGFDFRGLLFPGLMLTAEGPKVLEFNCRFGDPETQVLLPRLKSDLVDVLEAVIDGTLDRQSLEFDERAAVCVVMSSGGYPGKYETGLPISGLQQFENEPDVMVFHGGTREENGTVVTAGGRVLGVTALGRDVRAARERAYEAVAQIHFEGAHFRRDIAAKGLSA